MASHRVSVKFRCRRGCEHDLLATRFQGTSRRSSDARMAQRRATAAGAGEVAPFLGISRSACCGNCGRVCRNIAVVSSCLSSRGVERGAASPAGRGRPPTSRVSSVGPVLAMHRSPRARAPEVSLALLAEDLVPGDRRGDDGLDEAGQGFGVL